MQHLLVIRLSAMGDVAMTVPVLRVFRMQYPEIKVTVLTRAFFKPMFSDINGVDVYCTDLKGVHKGVIGLSKLFNELKKLDIDAVADLHNVLRTKILKFFFRANKIPFVQIDKGRKDKKALTRSENKVLKQLKTSHQRYADVFEKLEYSVDLSQADNDSKAQQLSSKLSSLIGDHIGKSLIGIAPFAQHPGKTYPTDLMEQVIDSLNNLGTYQILLFGGGEKEVEIFQKWETQYSYASNMAGKMNFEDELSVISNLDLMLSMDSGNGHLAAMFAVPVVTVWGVTHPYAGFSPFNQPVSNAILPDLKKYNKIPTSIYGNKLPEGYEEVMRSISPEMIIKKVEEVSNK